MDQNKANIEKHPDIYKRRQAIIEHTYGIIKRQWGFYFVSTKKGIKRASADVGLMFTAFNLRRLINIIDKNLFKQFLQELASLFFAKTTSLTRFLSLLVIQLFAVDFSYSKKQSPYKALKPIHY